MVAKRTTVSIAVSAMTLIVVLGALPPIVPATGHDTATYGTVVSEFEPAVNGQSEYNVTFNSTTIDELVLRNVVVTDVSVGTVTVDEMTVGNETTEDVQLENVTLERLEIEHAIVENVSTGELSVRNRSVLNVPGGELIGNAGDRSLKRHVVANLTVSGVEIEQLHLANLTVETDLETIEGDVDGTPDEEATTEPAVSIKDAQAGTATVTNASFERGSVESASVENETVTPEAASAIEVSVSARIGR